MQKSALQPFTPEWELAMLNLYNRRENKGVYTTTHFGMRAGLLGKLPRYLDQLRPDSNVLFIGVGEDIGNSCASEVMELSALLESCKFDYKMTVLDVKKEALEAARTRKSIYANPIGLKETEEWKKYLKRARRISYPGLVYSDPIPKYMWCRRAGLPRSFFKKRVSGEVRFVEEDMVSADLSALGPFDLAYSFNVLNQLSIEDKSGGYNSSRVLALWNIVKALSAGGILAIDNVSIRSHSGEWRTLSGDVEESELGRMMGVRIVSTKDLHIEHDSVILKKT